LATRRHSSRDPSLEALRGPLYRRDVGKHVTKIKKECGFKRQFGLLRRFRDIARDHRQWAGYQSCTAKEKRAFAGKVARQAADLRKTLVEARDDELAHLAGDSAGRPYRDAHGLNWRGLSTAIAQITPHLNRLQYSGLKANRQEMPRGRPKGKRLDTLFLLLRRMYVEAFGTNAPRLTQGDRITGKFPTFCLMALPLFGEKKPSNAALGSLIKKAIATVDDELSMKRGKSHR
jgi:hypothetical protein